MNPPIRRVKPLPRKSGFANWDPLERAWVEDVLEFANLPEPIPEKVYDLADRHGEWLDPPRNQVWSIQRLFETGDDATKIFSVDQAHLHGRLRAIRGTRGVGNIELADEVGEYVQRTVRPRYVPTIVDGQLVLITRPVLTGVEGFSAFGLVLLIDRRRPFGRALRQCRLESCKRWFLALHEDQQEARKGGLPPEYCTRKHQQDANRLAARKRMADLRKAKAAKHK